MGFTYVASNIDEVGRGRRILILKSHCHHHLADATRKTKTKARTCESSMTKSEGTGYHQGKK
jgi:hypothetical protein